MHNQQLNRQLTIIVDIITKKYQNIVDLHNKISVEEKEVKVKLRKVSFWCLTPFWPSIMTASKLYYNYAREFSRVTYRFVPKAVVL